MRKALTIAALTVGLAAQAEDFTYLTAAYNNIEQSFELATVQKITFEDDNVVIATSQGTTTLPLAQMEKMYFAGTATRVDAYTSGRVDEGVYDLSGRRISSTAKGIYIVDGKKVVR